MSKFGLINSITVGRMEIDHSQNLFLKYQLPNTMLILVSISRQIFEKFSCNFFSYIGRPLLAAQNFHFEEKGKQKHPKIKDTNSDTKLLRY